MYIGIEGVEKEGVKVEQEEEELLKEEKDINVHIK